MNTASPKNELMAIVLVTFFFVLPANLRAATQLTLDDDAVLLGQTESVGVTIVVDEPKQQDVARPLRLAVNVGSFSGLFKEAANTYRTVYLPPTTRFPQVALVAVWRETGPNAPIDFFRIPLLGKTKLRVSGTPHATVKAKVGDNTFGPIEADGKGAAAIPIHVPPGVTQAMVTVATTEGDTNVHAQPIVLPPYNQLTAAVVPHTIVADGKSWARIDVMYDLGGVDVPADQIRLQPSVGEVALLSANQGRYVYRFTPPRGAVESEAQFVVSVEGDPAAKATTAVRLGLPEPAKIILRPPDATLTADGSSIAEISVSVIDRNGLGLANQKMNLTANGKPITGMVYRGNGVYEVPFVAPARYPPGGVIQFVAYMKAPNGRELSAAANYQLAPSNAPHELQHRLSPSPIPADGKSTAMLVLDIRDAAGRPVDDIQLLVVPSHGRMSAFRCEGAGRYAATFTAPQMSPDTDVYARIVDRAGEFEKTISIPLRKAMGTALVGAHAGFVRSPGMGTSPSVGIEASLPMQLQGHPVTIGVSTIAFWTSVRVEDPMGLGTEASLVSVPISARFAYEVLLAPPLTLYIGGGATVVFSRFRTAADDAQSLAVGGGGLLFFSGSTDWGPGQAFVEVSYAYSRVSNASFRANTGGLGASFGYRIRID